MFGKLRFKSWFRPTLVLKGGMKMANKNLFVSTPKPLAPAHDTINNAGGKAYKFADRHCLAQIACTNCFNGTYYSDADSNLTLAKEAVERLKDDPAFIAKVAIYSRDKGYMKDMPAYLTVMLAGLDTKLFRKVFRRVVDNGKMLRNVIQIARSGQAGKVYNMSSGTFRHAIQEWFDKRSPDSIFRASIGNDPSMKDILRMGRPYARNQEGKYSPEKDALFAYLREAEFKDGEYLVYKGKGKDRHVSFRHAFDALPEKVRQYELYKKDRSLPIPDIDFRFLDSFIPDQGWNKIAENAGWTMTRMNLNTFARHGVFGDSRITKLIADRLANKEEIVKAKAFPYQLLMAYKAANDVPPIVRDALQEAMEIATDNAPTFDGQIYVAVDTSGSMSSPVTGHRSGATTNVKCIDVAALFGSTILRKNRNATLVPFDTRIHDASSINPRDAIMTNAQKLAKFGGGGTNCGLPVEHLNQKNAKGDAVIFISDNESWVDSPRSAYYGNQGTALMSAWGTFKKRNPQAKLVCIDITPRDNSQVKQQHPDILQVAGFNDQVYDVVNSFLQHGHENDHWTAVIDAISLDD